jgi:hypothetical protein
MWYILRCLSSCKTQVPVQKPISRARLTAPRGCKSRISLNLFGRMLLITAYDITYQITMGQLCFARQQNRAYWAPALSCARLQNTNVLCQNFSGRHSVNSNVLHYQSGSSWGAIWSNGRRPADPVPTNASHCLICCGLQTNPQMTLTCRSNVESMLIKHGNQACQELAFEAHQKTQMHPR